MKRFLLAATVVALTVASADAGCPKSGAAGKTGPVRKFIQHLRDKRPASTAVANTLHAAGAFVESRPVATAVKSAFSASSCPGGVCPTR